MTDKAINIGTVENPATVAVYERVLFRNMLRHLHVNSVAYHADVIGMLLADVLFVCGTGSGFPTKLALAYAVIVCLVKLEAFGW